MSRRGEIPGMEVAHQEPPLLIQFRASAPEQRAPLGLRHRTHDASMFAFSQVQMLRHRKELALGVGQQRQNGAGTTLSVERRALCAQRSAVGSGDHDSEGAVRKLDYRANWV